MKNILLVLMIGLSLTSISQINEDILIQQPVYFDKQFSADSIYKKVLFETPQSAKPQAGQIKLPYPIIFIHGLTGSSGSAWNTTTNWMETQYGFNWGGTMHACLNYDLNNGTANLLYGASPGTGMDIGFFTPTLTVGDYYYLNFDIGYNGVYHPNGGTGDVQSNQSAVAKQGRSIRTAIYYVLQATGRDKVILMGHSMGGLAAREYLQNSALWQSDGRHHVAKLATTGTPHGGSNASFSLFNTIFAGINNEAEAVRDLRETYFYSGNAGVYLSGGLESLTYMNDIFCCYFDNADVNCNGVTGETIIGLNNKSIDYGIDYSCIIGTANGLNGGDYVVDNENADLNNYKAGITQNTFAVNVSHPSLPNQNYQNMQGLDEPSDYYCAYNIGFDTTYTGFTTMQAIGGYSSDWDDYKFKVTGNSIVTVNINNISLANLMVSIVETNTNNIGPIFQSGGFSSITYTQAVNAGSFYLEIYGVPTATSYLYPYNFILSQVPSAIGINELSNKLKDISIYPNPAKTNLTIESENFGTNYTFEILNCLGQVVYNSILLNNKTVVDVNQLPSSVYLIKISADNSFTYKKFIKE
jgi:triacylglycerol esterase/lipase EstA (alpha/beta hydrolase family)